MEGHRPEHKQNQMVREGKSKLVWPNSKHNQNPSIAVDVVPYPIDWEDKERFKAFAGYVFGMATILGIRLRWGGTWSNNPLDKEASFYDAVHFELTNRIVQ